MLTDEQLMYQLKNGQYNTADVLYSRYKRPLLGYFINNISDKDLSEDLVQLTFEKMIKFREKYNNTGLFKAWLFTIARNTMYDFLEKRKRTRSNYIKTDIPDILTSDSYDEESDRVYKMKRALNNISEEKRELISMVKLQGMRYKDAALIYNTTEGNIKIKVFRILKELRELMQIEEKVS